MNLLLQQTEQHAETIREALAVLKQPEVPPRFPDLQFYENDDAREEHNFEDLARETPPRLLRRLFADQRQHHAMRIGVVDTLSKAAAARAKAKAEAPAKMARRWRENTRVRVRAREEEAKAREEEAKAKKAEAVEAKKLAKAEKTLNAQREKLANATAATKAAEKSAEEARKRVKKVGGESEAAMPVKKRTRVDAAGPAPKTDKIWGRSEIQGAIAERLKKLTTDNRNQIFTKFQLKNELDEEFWKKYAVAAKKAFFNTNVPNGSLKGWIVGVETKKDEINAAWIGYLNMPLWEVRDLAIKRYEPYYNEYGYIPYEQWEKWEDKLEKQLIRIAGFVADNRGTCSKANRPQPGKVWNITCGTGSEDNLYVCARCTQYLIQAACR